VLTRSVRDSAVMLDAICGPDIGAPFVVPRPPRPFAEEARRDPGRLRIAFSTVSPIGRPVAASCVAAVEDAARLLSGLGHEVEPAQPQIDGMALARAFFTMYFGNVAASMKEIRAQTGAGDDEFELGTRLLGAVGRRLPAADYVATLRSWNDFARSLGRFLQRYDLYMTPTVAGPPPRIGEFDLKPAEAFALPIVLALGGAGLLHKAGIVEKTMLQSLERTPFTQLANLTGTPGMSVPLHWDEDGLPVGVQFVAANGEEAVLVRLARQLEQARPWAQRRPPLHAGAHPHPGNAQATSN
jgi:amidase